ncbi:unnamed protein product [Sphagnum balticum]
MMVSTLCGYNLLVGGNEELEPDLEILEKLADEAFKMADKNHRGAIAYDEFIPWARSNRDLMIALEKLSKPLTESKEDLDEIDSARTQPDDSDHDIDDIPSQLHQTKSLNDILKGPVGGDENLAVVQWTSQIHSPTTYIPSKKDKEGPKSHLELNWAFGYNGSISKKNVRYLPGLDSNQNVRCGRAVFPVAAVAVILDLKMNKQQFYQGHSERITCLAVHPNDIKYLRSCGAEGAVLYWTIGGVQVKSSSSLRDVTWATNSAVFAWGTQGIWPPGSDFTDVNSCDASPDLGVIISGDDFKKVNLYRYPCVVKGAVRLTYTGHGSHVMGVVLSCSRQYVASIGGADNSLLVWNHFLEIEDSDADNATVSSSGSASASASAKSNVGAHSDDWLMNEPTQGDEFMAVKPWKSAIIEPSQWEEATGASDCDLALQWVHGFSVTRPLFSSNYLFYSSAGDIVYPAAALGIIYRKNTKKQCFIQGAHDDEILSMAIHPSGQIFASGQSGKNAAIVVWNSDDTQTIRRLDKAHQRGVSQLAFNTQGNLLASLGLDNDNSLAIHNWSSGIEILRTPIDKGKVLCLCFFHLDSDVSSKSSEETVVTGGEKLLKFWTFQGKNVKSQRAMWGDYKRTTVLSVVSGSKGTCITGTKEGDLLLWKDYKVTYSVNLFNFRILSNHHGIYFY